MIRFYVFIQDIWCIHWTWLSLDSVLFWSPKRALVVWAAASWSVHRRLRCPGLGSKNLNLGISPGCFGVREESRLHFNVTPNSCFSFCIASQWLASCASVDSLCKPHWTTFPPPHDRVCLKSRLIVRAQLREVILAIITWQPRLYICSFHLITFSIYIKCAIGLLGLGCSVSN